MREDGGGEGKLLPLRRRRSGWTTAVSPGSADATPQLIVLRGGLKMGGPYRKASGRPELWPEPSGPGAA